MLRRSQNFYALQSYNMFKYRASTKSSFTNIKGNKVNCEVLPDLGIVTVQEQLPTGETWDYDPVTIRNSWKY